MIELDNIQKVYFLGVGGIGMSALARYFKLQGSAVSGYDKTQTPLTQKLESEGMSIHYLPDSSAITKDIDLVIYTPAIPSDNEEWDTIKSLHLPLMKRAEVLGLISNRNQCLAIAGTHGKTTTSAILAHMLNSYFGGVNAFVGGIMTNSSTNFLYGGNSDLFVVEADEFDRSFLHLQPQIAVINSVDADHLDVYGGQDLLVDSFKEFASKVKPSGQLIVQYNLADLFKNQVNKMLSFGVEVEADFVAKNVHIKNGKFIFDLHDPNGIISDLSLSLPGKHNIENAIAACAVALLSGVTEDGIKSAISTFSGVKRRFEISGNYNETIYIDDYAHHPTEILMVLEAGRELYPTKRLTAIFQPHLFSRTRDFEDEFALALSGFDEVILLDIYPARELPIKGVTSAHLLEKIELENKVVLSKSEVVNYLSNKEFEVLFTLGAGDIDTLVNPIKELVVG